MKKAIRIIVAVALCVGLVCWYYYYISNREANTTETVSENATEVEKILAKDFTNDYPSTAREVVKWYNRIITALYAEDYDEDEFDAMADQLRALLDEDLLELNPRDSYIDSLQADVDDYKEREKRILQSSVSDSDDIDYVTIEGSYCAYVKSYYFSREGSDFSRTYEEFVLRKNDDGQWKILSFRQIEGDNDGTD